MAKRLNKLGSVISHYKHEYKSSKNRYQQYQIEEVIKRLEGYQKYQKQIIAERYNLKRRQESKFLRKLRKDSYKKAFSIKPVSNPYVEMSKHLYTPVDPTLYKRYQSKHIYSMYEFRHMKLPRSNNVINAGQGWNGLINAWTGYKISKRLENTEKIKLYASATQKFAYLLNAPMMPDFTSIGLSAIGILSPKTLKNYFIGYERELLGDE